MGELRRDDALLRRSFGASQSGFEAIAAKRLQQVIDGVDFKGPDCVIIVGGDEDDGGAGADQLEDFEAIELGHLDIEENEVGLQFGDGFYGFEAVGAFGGDFDFGMGSEKFAQDLAGELLVVDDYGANFLVGRLRHWRAPPDVQRAW